MQGLKAKTSVLLLQLASFHNALILHDEVALTSNSARLRAVITTGEGSRKHISTTKLKTLRKCFSCDKYLHQRMNVEKFISCDAFHSIYLHYMALSL